MVDSLSEEGLLKPQGETVGIEAREVGTEYSRQGDEIKVQDIFGRSTSKKLYVITESPDGKRNIVQVEKDGVVIDGAATQRSGVISARRLSKESLGQLSVTIGGQPTDLVPSGDGSVVKQVVSVFPGSFVDPVTFRPNSVVREFSEMVTDATNGNPSTIIYPEARDSAHPLSRLR